MDDKKRRIRKIIKTLVSITFFFILWQVICDSGRFEDYLLPSPVTVSSRLNKIIINGLLIEHIWASLKRVFTGYAISSSLAFFFALMRLFFPKKMEYLDWLFNFMRSIPPLGLIPLLILWFGIGEVPKIIVIIMSSFFSMYSSFEKGLLGTDPKLLELGKSFGFSEVKIFWKIILPYGIPDFLVGLRVGLGYCYRGIIGAEMLAASSGLGYLISFGRAMSQTDTVLVGIITMGLLGYLSDKMLRISVNYLLKGRFEYDAN